MCHILPNNHTISLRTIGSFLEHIGQLHLIFLHADKDYACKVTPEAFQYIQTWPEASPALDLNQSPYLLVNVEGCVIAVHATTGTRISDATPDDHLVS